LASVAAEEADLGGRLTPEERDEYDALVRVGNFVAILQAKARRLSAEGHAARAHAHRLGGPKLTTEFGTRSAVQWQDGYALGDPALHYNENDIYRVHG
jgi:hypothetical protein